MSIDTFQARGYEIIADAVPPVECESLAETVRDGAAQSGARCFLAEPWCAALSMRLRGHARLAELIPAGHVAVQCTYFEKSTDQNWLVPVHQDLSIPVASRVSDPDLRGWSKKEGQLFVQAPVALLEQLIAVRVHLDPCGELDGPLKVVPGSHMRGIVRPEAAVHARQVEGEVACLCDRGGALVMRPLLLHASAKSAGHSRRRVLHFVFGPRVIGYGLRWHHAV